MTPLSDAEIARLRAVAKKAMTARGCDNTLTSDKCPKCAFPKLATPAVVSALLAEVDRLREALFTARDLTKRPSGDQSYRIYCDFCEATFDGPDHPDDSDCTVAGIEREYRRANG